VGAPEAEIRVLLVDDHAIERQGVRALLDVQPDITVVGEAADGLDALPLVGSCAPSVVVTETIMPRMNGLELTEQVLKRYPDMRVLVLTRSERQDCLLRVDDHVIPQPEAP
jgi:DNA-binding NarL/FixJ family response regulator